MAKSFVFTGCYLVIILLFGSPALAENLVIAGTGDSQFILKKLAVLFEHQNPGINVEVPDSIGSGGGVKALIQHKVGLARTARALKKKELKRDLFADLFAFSPIVFVSHPEAGVKNITTQQVINIFAGKLRNWKELGGPDHKIYLIDRETGDSSRIVLEKKLPGFKDIKSKGKIFYKTSETAEAIGQHSFTIGYVPLSVALEYKLNIFSLDDKVAASEDLQSDEYSLLTPFYLIRSKQSGPLAKSFMDFVFSQDAQKLMRNNGVFPVSSLQ